MKMLSDPAFSLEKITLQNSYILKKKAFAGFFQTMVFKKCAWFSKIDICNLFKLNQGFQNSTKAKANQSFQK